MYEKTWHAKLYTKHSEFDPILLPLKHEQKISGSQLIKFFAQSAFLVN
jgi:hypothetical protein